jgi:hypothetical protein
LCGSDGGVVCRGPVLIDAGFSYARTEDDVDQVNIAATYVRMLPLVTELMRYKTFTRSTDEDSV